MSKRTLDAPDAIAVRMRIDLSIAAHQYSTLANAKAMVDELGLDADVFLSQYDMCYCGRCCCHDLNIAHASRGEPSKRYAFPIDWLVPPEVVQCLCLAGAA